MNFARAKLTAFSRARELFEPGMTSFLDARDKPGHAPAVDTSAEFMVRLTARWNL